ncbi:MAG: hypothetical protein ACYCUE_16165, partial [Steroidobacteraceae bacterium]
RTPHRPFFSPPIQRNDPSPGVTEHPLHEGAGSKAWESVCVHQVVPFALLGHPAIMPDFSVKPRPQKPMNTEGCASLSNNFTHTKPGRADVVIGRGIGL